MYHFPYRLPHFFRSKPSIELEELFLTAAIMDFAASAIALFEPIYLWTLGFDVRAIMFFYLMVYVPYFFIVPLGGKFVARFGHQRSILISTIFLVMYLAALVNIADYRWLFFVAPIFLTLQKTFYWPAYHVDFMRFSVREERGSEYSALWAISTMMFVLGPIVGGTVVKFFGFPALFMGASFLILLSSTPLFISRVEPKRESFSYWKSLALPFRKRYHKNSRGYMALGEELILITIWPIFLLLTLKDNLFNVGLFVGGSAFLTAFATLAIGKLTDRIKKHTVLAVGGISTAVSWLVRLLPLSPATAFVVDTYSRINRNTTFVSMTTMTYDRAHDDDLSWHGVLYEQGFAIAKSSIAVAVIILASVADPFAAAFVVSAVVSLFYLVF